MNSRRWNQSGQGDCNIQARLMNKSGWLCSTSQFSYYLISSTIITSAKHWRVGQVAMARIKFACLASSRTCKVASHPSPRSPSGTNDAVSSPTQAEWDNGSKMPKAFQYGHGGLGFWPRCEVKGKRLGWFERSSPEASTLLVKIFKWQNRTKNMTCKTKHPPYYSTSNLSVRWSWGIVTLTGQTWTSYALLHSQSEARWGEDEVKFLTISSSSNFVFLTF